MDMEEYLGFIILAAVVVLVYVLSLVIINPLAKKWAARTVNKFDDLLVEKHVVTRALQIVPAVVFSVGLPYVVNTSDRIFEVCTQISNAWFTLLAFALGCAGLDVVEDLNGKNQKMQHKPLHGIFQAIKVAGFCVTVILLISQITEKSPVIILSAMGAMATVLMLIFRDSILGVVSGVQINLSDLLRMGDWIQIDRHQADGTVIDITLTSVKVKNWDNTITVVPAYDLITNSFRNWRSMEESGGRRIKRSLFIDQHTIRFLTDDEVERLSRVEILAPYLKQKMSEITNCGIGADSSTEAKLNCLHLTNIGTFRAYCNAYLKSCPAIAQKMTLMTRQLQPTPQGLPLEIYAFANDTRWVNYENIQSDIFDHLIAALPEFGLELFQYTSIPKDLI